MVITGNWLFHSSFSWFELTAWWWGSYAIQFAFDFFPPINSDRAGVVAQRVSTGRPKIEFPC
jgi:hypothetical protein